MIMFVEQLEGCVGSRIWEEVGCVCVCVFVGERFRMIQIRGFEEVGEEVCVCVFVGE
jgi:hypothetical protein